MNPSMSPKYALDFKCNFRINSANKIKPRDVHRLGGRLGRVRI